MMLEDPVTDIGIDIDCLTKNYQEWRRFKTHVMSRIKEINLKYGSMIYENYATKHGHHYRIAFGFMKPTLLESWEIRHYCYDDNNRLVMDMLRNLSGAKLTDTLFDKKEKKRFKIRVPVKTGRKSNYAKGLD